MILQIETNQLKSLMESFYTLSGIRFVLFDCDFNEVISYPNENCDFCSLMKSCSKTRRKCNDVDRRSIRKCKEKNELVVYKCHAGLVEAVIPLHENERIIGFLMFGQITDSVNKSPLFAKAPVLSEKYGLDFALLKKGIANITYKTSEEIRAAAKIMEACTSYIIYKELITPKEDRILCEAKEYIANNLEKNLDAQTLCSALKIGRTKLYGIFRKELGSGISKYVLICRLKKAKTLLKTTKLTIPEIACMVGFTDYNYFSRVYKNQYGKSPKSYRKS